jgi:DNA polymerase bacteriophage-type
VLYLDLETYSDLDLKKVSLDRYASHPSTRILMCAYAGDTGPVEIWQEGDPGLDELQRRMAAETCVAWNVGFENTLTSRVWRLRNVEWWDAMVLSLYSGLPAGLKDCNRVPFFANESETSKETLLINKFCKPQKDGGKRGPETDPEDWDRFREYCKADVFDTRLIYQWLAGRFNVPERVIHAWRIDQAINQRGMPVDRLLTFRAWEEAQRLQAEGIENLKTLTGLENPNSPAQLLKWVSERGYPYGGLGKELVQKALKEDPGTGTEDIDVDD